MQKTFRILFDELPIHNLCYSQPFYPSEKVNEKVHAALDARLTPIVCLGETLEQREANQTMAVVRRQLDVDDDECGR